MQPNLRNQPITINVIADGTRILSSPTLDCPRCDCHTALPLAYVCSYVCSTCGFTFTSLHWLKNNLDNGYDGYTHTD